jgi:hypothetical protein
MTSTEAGNEIFAPIEAVKRLAWSACDPCLNKRRAEKARRLFLVFSVARGWRGRQPKIECYNLRHVMAR